MLSASYRETILFSNIANFIINQQDGRIQEKLLAVRTEASVAEYWIMVEDAFDPGSNADILGREYQDSERSDCEIHGYVGGMDSTIILFENKSFQQ